MTRKEYKELVGKLDALAKTAEDLRDKYNAEAEAKVRVVFDSYTDVFREQVKDLSDDELMAVKGAAVKDRNLRKLTRLTLSQMVTERVGNDDSLSNALHLFDALLDIMGIAMEEGDDNE